MRNIARPHRQIPRSELNPHLVEAGWTARGDEEMVAEPGAARVCVAHRAARIVAADREPVVLVTVGEHLRDRLRLRAIDHRQSGDLLARGEILLHQHG